MCKVLQVSRSTYYYEAKQKTDESELTASIIDIFKASRNNYGTRKIKQELSKKGMIVSRLRIGRIMKYRSEDYFHVCKRNDDPANIRNHRRYLRF